MRSNGLPDAVLLIRRRSSGMRVILTVTDSAESTGRTGGVSSCRVSLIISLAAEKLKLSFKVKLVRSHVLPCAPICQLRRRSDQVPVLILAVDYLPGALNIELFLVLF